MGEKKLLHTKLKNKIKQIIEEKKVNKARLSVSLGYEKNFLNTYFSKPDKFFNLEHIEKICAALDYPVAELFEDDSYPQEEIPPGRVVQNQADPIEWALVEIFRGLSPKHKGKLVGVAEDLRLAEAIPPKIPKKASAAA